MFERLGESEAAACGASAMFVWQPGPPPVGRRVVQVYGWLMDRHGRVLVQRTPEGPFNLPGGKPESCDVDHVATLVREAAEESQVDVGETALLGFEEFSARGVDPVVLLRLAGRITGFAPRRPDVDGGRLLGRHMTSLALAPALLGWGLPGRAQAAAVAELAESSWALPATSPTAPTVEVL